MYLSPPGQTLSRHYHFSLCAFTILLAYRRADCGGCAIVLWRGSRAFPNSTFVEKLARDLVEKDANEFGLPSAEPEPTSPEPAPTPPELEPTPIPPEVEPTIIPVTD